MRLLLAFILVAVGASHGLGEDAKPRYKRFPETISPDGTSALAWGPKLPVGAEPEAWVEVPYGTRIDLKNAQIQDYFVDTRKANPPQALPKFEYFSGIEGHEGSHGLSYTWSPDSKSVMVLYEDEKGYVALAWMDAATRWGVECGKAVERTVRTLVAERFGEKEEVVRRAVYFTRLSLLEADLFTIDCCLTQPSTNPDDDVSYWFRIRFRIVTEDGKKFATAISARILHAEDLAGSPPPKKGETVDDQIEQLLNTLRGPLGPGDRELLKKEQSLWLKQREGLPTAGSRSSFSQHRLEELRIRVEEKP